MQGFLFWSRSPALEQIRTIISRLGGMAGQEGQICRPVLPEGKKGTRVSQRGCPIVEILRKDDTPF